VCVCVCVNCVCCVCVNYHSSHLVCCVCELIYIDLLHNMCVCVCCVCIVPDPIPLFGRTKREPWWGFGRRVY